MSFGVAYVLLWFPLASETFIYREICELMKIGLRIRVYTMYGKAMKGCSSDMKTFPGPVERMGLKSIFSIFGAMFRAFRRNPRKVANLFRQGFFRRMRNLEAQAENSWCFMAGFLLAEKCRQDGMDLIHSSWANGPATAAWVASRLSGIPFAFTGRAGDIYPQDGLLSEKSADALFIRTNNAANVEWLRKFCPKGEKDKVKLVYNNLTFPKLESKMPPDPPPYRILAIGRMVRTKGFPELLTAVARLRREGLPVHLAIVGDGSWRKKLLRMRGDLKLENCISMPGFVPHDQLRDLSKKYHLLVVPSVIHKNGDRDGIPNVIMEAMNAGLPVVASDVCGISEVVKNGETGLLVPQRNPAALADAMRYMLENPEFAQKTARSGKKLVHELFNTSKNTLALADLYYFSVMERANGR